MAQEEVLRMVAAARDQASGPLRKVEDALRGLGKHGGEQSKQLRENFKTVHEQFSKVAEIAREGVSPAIEAIGVSSLSAVGGMAALVSGLKNFVDQGDDVAAFGRKVQLTTDTIRGLEGAAGKFHVDPSAIRQGEQAFTDVMYKLRRGRDELGLFSRRRSFAEELAATPETVAGNEKALRTYLETLEKIKKEHGEMTARAFSKEMTGTDSFVDLLRKGNAGLDEARKKFLALSGAMDTNAGEKWMSNWSDFKAAIEGVRNAVGNDLLPDLTEMAKQAQAFFAEHKAEIGHDIADSVREIGVALRGVNTGVQAMGGWKTVFEGLLALKIAGLAVNILSVAGALGRLTNVVAAAPWLLRLLGVSAAEAVGGGLVGAGVVAAYHAGSKDEGPILARMSQLRSQVNSLEKIADRKQYDDGDPTGAATTRGKISALNDELTRLTQKLKEVQDAAPAASEGGFAQGVKSFFGGLYDRGGRRHLGKYLDSQAGAAASIIQGLRDRGLDAPHAAILAGSIEQESGFDSTRPNVAEGGIGLLQWNKERRAALQALAAQKHKLETDAGVQLDFMMKEINETRQGRAFMADQSMDGMNRDLHSHIRYGDNSEGRRLANGLALLPQAERAQPGSLLAAASKSGIGGGATTVTGSASLDVNVRAPPGTSVRADAKGLFDRVNVDRGLSLSKPLASDN